MIYIIIYSQIKKEIQKIYSYYQKANLKICENCINDLIRDNINFAKFFSNESENNPNINIMKELEKNKNIDLNKKIQNIIDNKNIPNLIDENKT